MEFESLLQAGIHERKDTGVLRNIIFAIHEWKNRCGKNN